MYRLYVADDDAQIQHILKSQLEKDGYHVETFADGEALIKRFKELPCDLIMTDIMMPKLDGYEVCKVIRQMSDVPILMISAKDEEFDRVLGLELGSDDYIAKPFSLREVSVKIKNILRRIHKTAPKEQEGCYVCKNLTLNEVNHEVRINGQLLEATVKEYELLLLLVSNQNQAFSRDKIIEKVWGYDYCGETRQVDHLIKRLRKKMLLAESECKIETIWGYGYKVSGER